MRFAILLSGMLISGVIAQANKLERPSDVATILAWLLIAAGIMDITEWLATLLKADKK